MQQEFVMQVTCSDSPGQSLHLGEQTRPLLGRFTAP